MASERLHKALARAGVASRRGCEALISAGRVKVNGQVVREPGARVDLDYDHVRVDDRPVEQPGERVYIVLHKPVGVVSTADDPQGRTTVTDLVGGAARIFPVGRLDANSEGLLLLTNDGELTYRLTHPRFEVEKEYRALLDCAPTDEALRRWRAGVMLEGRRTAPAQVDLLEQASAGAWLRVVLREGRKRQIREVALVLGYHVRRLIRVREGPLHLGGLAPGQWRVLRAEEVQALRAHVSPAAGSAPEADSGQGTLRRRPRRT